MRAVLLAMATAATLLGLRNKMSANHGSNLSGSDLMVRMRDVMLRTNRRRYIDHPSSICAPSVLFHRLIC